MQLRRDAGIGHFEYQVMALLSEAPSSTLRMSELAMMAEGSLPRLSQAGRHARAGAQPDLSFASGSTMPKIAVDQHRHDCRRC